MWPATLRRLEFGEFFNQSIEEAKLPASLEHLVLGHDPASLENLVLGHDFNSIVDAVVWPASLTSVSFGATFNQPIHKGRLAFLACEFVVWRWFQLDGRRSRLAGLGEVVVLRGFLRPAPRRG